MVALVALIGAIPAGAGTASSSTSWAAPILVPAPPPAARAWVLVDADTGAVLSAGHDRAPLPPASLTKVITALAAGKLPVDAAVPVSLRAEAAPADKMYMKHGQVWTFDEMLHTLLISSANDAAVALAEKVGGTLEGFQPIFARTALGLGMADHPVLNDPAGLDGPEGVEGGNLVSARDLAIAARALLAQPFLAQIVATPVYYFGGPDHVRHRLTSHNRWFLTSYPGAIGVKTGYTKRAGGCLIAAARRNGRTMLAVVLNGDNPNQSAKDLLDQGFNTPINVEPVADRLPPVNRDPTAPPTTLAPTTLAPPATVARPVALDLRKGSSESLLSARRSWWMMPILGLLLVVVISGWRASRRRRRPTFLRRR